MPGSLRRLVDLLEVLLVKRRSIHASANSATPALTVPRESRHFVYQANCNECGDQYIGASRRPILNRIQEHESSFRINNDRTTLGQHAAKHRHNDGTIYVPTTGTRNFESFFKQYSFDVVKKCKDTLETFINEGMLITSTKPKLNNMLRNGFTE